MTIRVVAACIDNDDDSGELSCSCHKAFLSLSLSLGFTLMLRSNEGKNAFLVIYFFPHEAEKAKAGEKKHHFEIWPI